MAKVPVFLHSTIGNQHSSSLFTSKQFTALLGDFAWGRGMIAFGIDTYVIGMFMQVICDKTLAVAFMVVLNIA